MSVARGAKMYSFFFSATVYPARHLGSVHCEGGVNGCWSEQSGASASQLFPRSSSKWNNVWVMI